MWKIFFTKLEKNVENQIEIRYFFIEWNFISIKNYFENRVFFAVNLNFHLLEQFERKANVAGEFVRILILVATFSGCNEMKCHSLLCPSREIHCLHFIQFSADLFVSLWFHVDRLICFKNKEWPNVKMVSRRVVENQRKFDNLCWFRFSVSLFGWHILLSKMVLF